jgi:hypothetical protein
MTMITDFLNFANVARSESIRSGMGGGEWTGLIWLRIRTAGGRL